MFCPLSPASGIEIGTKIEGQPATPRGEPGVLSESTCEPGEPEPALGTWPAPDPELPLPRAPAPAAEAAHKGDRRGAGADVSKERRAAGGGGSRGAGSKQRAAGAAAG